MVTISVKMAYLTFSNVLLYVLKKKVIEIHSIHSLFFLDHTQPENCFQLLPLDQGTMFKNADIFVITQIYLCNFLTV